SEHTASVSVSSGEVLIQTSYSVTISATDADSVTLYVTHAYSDGHTDESTLVNWFGSVDTTITESQYTPMQVTYRLEAVFGEETVEDTATVSVISYGWLDTVTVNVPRRIDLGSDLTFSIGEVANAASYEVFLWSSTGSTLLDQWYSFAGEITLSADLMQTEGDYLLAVQPHADGYESPPSSSVKFTVGTIDKTVSISVSKTDVLVYESFTISASAPHADSVTIYKRTITPEIDYGYSIESQAAGTWETRATLAGQLEYKITAIFDGEEISDSVTLNVSSYGQLDTPVITGVPSESDAGSDVTFTIEATPNATEYQIGLIHRTTHNYLYSGSTAEAGSFTIPGEYFAAEGIYDLSVWAIGQGYTDSPSASFMIKVGELDLTATLSVSKSNLLVGEHLDIIVNAPNADSVSIYFRDMYDNGGVSEYQWLAVEGGVNDTFGYRENNPLQKDIRLEAYFDGELVTDSVTVTVTAYGQTGSPTVTGVPSQIEVGEGFTFSIAGVPDVMEYLYYVTSSTGETVCDAYLYADGSATISGDVFASH
ncbi:MAG: hypothetical protein IJV64_11260, partial [Oscillospiraceae bacterium]|nr:hypothetical protein [Oscillospiraceae bacterium]